MRRAPSAPQNVATLIAHSRNDWDHILTRDSINAYAVTLQDAEREATGLAVIAGELAAYLSARGAGIGGDKGHDKALAYAEKRRKALRKVLGFTYP